MSTVSDEIIQTKTNELRMWILVHALLGFCFSVMLTSMDKPLQLVGIMLLIDLIIFLPVLYGFHEANCLERIMQMNGQDSAPIAIVPPCNGALGTGGTTPAFVAYILGFSLYTYTLFTFYAACRFDSFKVRLSTMNYFCVFSAAFLVLLSLFLLEIGKNARMRFSFA